MNCGYVQMPEAPRALDRAEAGVMGSWGLSVAGAGTLQDPHVLSTTGLSLQLAEPLYLVTDGSTVPWADLLFLSCALCILVVCGVS